MSNLRPNDPYSTQPFTRLRATHAVGERDNVTLLTKALRRRLKLKRLLSSRELYRLLVRKNRKRAAAELEATRLAATTLQVVRAE